MRQVHQLLVGVLVLGGLAIPAQAELDVPLPERVSALPKPTQIRMGLKTLTVQSFMTELEADEVISFYEQALPKRGFRLDLLPWQAGHVEATKRLEEHLKNNPDSPDAPTWKERLTEYQRTTEAMKRQLYARRGLEYVIVNFWPLERGTLVFINHSTGDRSWLEGKHIPGSRAARGQFR